MRRLGNTTEPPQCGYIEERRSIMEPPRSTGASIAKGGRSVRSRESPNEICMTHVSGQFAGKMQWRCNKRLVPISPFIALIFAYMREKLRELFRNEASTDILIDQLEKEGKNLWSDDFTKEQREEAFCRVITAVQERFPRASERKIADLWANLQMAYVFPDIICPYRSRPGFMDGSFSIPELSCSTSTSRVDMDVAAQIRAVNNEPRHIWTSKSGRDRRGSAFHPDSYEEPCVLLLIHLIKPQTHIWNKNDGHVKTENEKSAAWSQVSAEFRKQYDWSETKMKICWKTLVRYYRKNNRKTRKYVKKLRFLKKSTLWAKKYEQPGASAAPSNKSWNRKRQ
uniref:MADF domain-containing protein n=1 Tax=Steinernema glaseri TaxID=37863 RepID=A0A1I7ZHT1_9BILA